MAELDYQLHFLGSVNRWECDENDHLNVRFYSRMADEALSSAIGQWASGDTWRVELQHMRYLAEARLATPISGYVARVGSTARCLTVLIELRNTMTGQVLATLLTEIGGPSFAEADPVSLPPHAGARGVPTEDHQLSGASVDQLLEHGLVRIGQGVVRRDECDSDGALPPFGVMGRMSDSMPNLWSHLNTEEELAARSEGFLGGAVVEYRMRHHKQLRAGDQYVVCSGVAALAEKTQHFAHFMLDARSGEPVMSGQAVAVVLDLQARKSVALPPDRRARMERLLIRG